MNGAYFPSCLPLFMDYLYDTHLNGKFLIDLIA